LDCEKYRPNDSEHNTQRARGYGANVGSLLHRLSGQKSKSGANEK